MGAEQAIEVINEAAHAHNAVKGLSGANALTLVSAIHHLRAYVCL